MTLESTKPRESESGGRFWIWFAGIVFFALLIRAVNAHFLLQDDNPHYRAWIFPDTDMARNHNYAKEILANRGFPKDFFQHSPLYPCIIASVYAFAPDRFDLVYRLQYFAGALLCGLIYWVGRRLWNEPVGRVAGIGAAVYGPLIFNEVTFMSDSLSPVFVTAFIALVLIYERAERGHLPLAAAIGLSLGLATGERSNMALLGVALVPWMWFVPRHIPLKTRLISLALIAAVSIAVISPFCYHNTMVRGQLSFTQGEPNITFRVGWGVESPGYFNFPNGWPNNPMLTPFSPGFLLLLARKIRFYLSWFEFPDLYNYYIDGRFSPLIKYNPFTFALLGPLALLGTALNFRRRRELSLVYTAFFTIMLSVIMFYVAARFRASAIPFFLLFGASAAVWLWDQLRSRRWKPFCAAAVLLALLALFCNSLDTSRFHSMWYSDSMMLNGFRVRVRQALETDHDTEKAKEILRRFFWIKEAPAHYLGHGGLSELALAESDMETYQLHSRVAQALRERMELQSTLDHLGNRFFPPTDTFGEIDPFQSVAPPSGMIGGSAMP